MQITQEDRLAYERKNKCKAIDRELAQYFFKGSQVIDDFDPALFVEVWRRDEEPVDPDWAETVGTIIATMVARIRDDELALREHCRKIDRLPFKY